MIREDKNKADDSSHSSLSSVKGDEFTRRMLGAINSMRVEIMAAIARKD